MVGTSTISATASEIIFPHWAVAWFTKWIESVRCPSKASRRTSASETSSPNRIERWRAASGTVSQSLSFRSFFKPAPTTPTSDHSIRFTITQRAPLASVRRAGEPIRSPSMASISNSKQPRYGPSRLASTAEARCDDYHRAMEICQAEKDIRAQEIYVCGYATVRKDERTRVENVEWREQRPCVALALEAGGSRQTVALRVPRASSQARGIPEPHVRNMHVCSHEPEGPCDSMDPLSLTGGSWDHMDRPSKGALRESNPQPPLFERALYAS